MSLQVSSHLMALTLLLCSSSLFLFWFVFSLFFPCRSADPCSNLQCVYKCAPQAEHPTDKGRARFRGCPTLLQPSTNHRRRRGMGVYAPSHRLTGCRLPAHTHCNTHANASERGAMDRMAGKGTLRRRCGSLDGVLLLRDASRVAQRGPESWACGMDLDPPRTHRG